MGSFKLISAISVTTNKTISSCKASLALTYSFPPKRAVIKHALQKFMP